MATMLGYSNFNGKNGDKFSADLLYDILEKNIEGNYYRIRLYGYIRSWGYSGSGSYAIFYINGENSGGFSSISANQYSEVARKDIMVYGDPQGRCVLNWSFSVDTNWSLGDASASGSLTLDTIPRASSVTCTDGMIESSVSININRASDTFTHTLRYSFGSLSGTIATGIGMSHGWVLPTTFYSQIPNSKSGIGVVYCDTYSGGTLLGTSQVTFNVYTDESKCKPDVTATVIDNNQTTVALTGDNNKIVKFASNAKITITATAKNSSSISNRTATCSDGKSGSGTEVILNKVESGNFTISATDSRGYTTSIPINKTLVDYVTLTINSNFYRPEDTTGEVKLSYDGNYYIGSFGTSNNSLTVKYRYKESTTSSWDGVEYITITPTISEEDNTYSGDVSLGTNFNYQKAYDFEIVATDLINTVSQTAYVSEGIPMFAMFKDHLEAFGNKLINDEGEFFLPAFTYVYSGDTNIIHHNDEGKSTFISTNNGDIVFRPKGISSATNQMRIDANGNLHLPAVFNMVSEGVTVLNRISNKEVAIGTNGSNIIFRPNGVDSLAGQTYVTATGDLHVSGNVYTGAGASFQTNIYAPNFFAHDGRRAVLGSNVYGMTMMSNPYLEVQTANIGGITAFGVNVWSSDKRLKKSIVDSEINALEIVKQIKHREFKYKHNDELVKIGYIADELEEIDESLIFEVGEDKLKQPKESVIIPILSKAIQEQQEIIEQLKQQILELESKIETIK